MPGDFLKTDLAAFLNSNELGDVAVYNGDAFNCQFFNEYEAVNLFGLNIESASPFIIAQDENVEDIPLGAKLIIGKSLSIADDSFEDINTIFDTEEERFEKAGSQTEYKIVNKQPDGTGLTTLILSKD